MPATSQIPDETAVVLQAREGDAKAFSELVRRYEGKIFRLAMHITQNREDAGDVLQETFLKSRPTSISISSRAIRSSTPGSRASP